MRTNLAIMVRPVTGSAPLWFYVPGQTILQETSDAVTRFEASAVKIPPRFGMQANPVPVIEPKFWMSSFVALRSIKPSAYYFKVAGRVIKKWPDKSVSGGHADGMYMSDVVLSGTDPVPEGESNRIWTREDGASYREFAKFMASCMPDGKELSWSENISQKMRQILSNKINAAVFGSTHIGAALPLLCSVMFISEPARNKRAWPLGLIMLDSIGQQYSVVTASNPAKYYTWDRVLAHPERIDPGYKGSDPISKPQKGPTGKSMGKYGAPTGFGPLALKKDLVKVEGKLPASPSGSASSGSIVDVANDYIQMKETSLVIRWLRRLLTQAHIDESSVEFVTWRDKDSLDGLTNLMNDVEITQMVAKPPASELGVTLVMIKEMRASLLTEIRGLLDKRCATFDAM
jgi:hypothetical protein